MRFSKANMTSVRAQTKAIRYNSTLFAIGIFTNILIVVDIKILCYFVFEYNMYVCMYMTISVLYYIIYYYIIIWMHLSNNACFAVLCSGMSDTFMVFFLWDQHSMISGWDSFRFVWSLLKRWIGEGFYAAVPCPRMYENIRL